MFQYAKQYITQNSIYSPQVLKGLPTESKVFPIVFIPECTMVIDDETRKYGEQKYRITFDIEIYATDQTIQVAENDNVITKKVSKRTIISELEKLLYDVFEDHYRMLGGQAKVRPNADINVSRLGIIFTGKFFNNIFYRR